MRKLLVLVLLALNTTIFAQKDFRPGYVILNSGDTLTGEIRSTSDRKMIQECYFREDEKSVISNFPPWEISGYRFNNGKYYISQTLPDSRIVFLEFLVNGKLNLYYARDNQGDHYFIKKEGTPIVEIPRSESMEILENSLLDRRPMRLVGFLTFMTEEAPELKGQIQSIKGADQKSLVKLAVNYHNAVCTDGTCIVYKKVMPVTRVSVQPVIGITHFRTIKGYSWEYGAYINFWLPITDERLYIKTGLTAVDIPKITDIIQDPRFGTYYKIPLQLRYLAPGKNVRPEFSIGSSLYLYHGPVVLNGYALSLSGGINIRMYKEYYWHIGATIETIPLYLLPMNLMESRVFSHSMRTGFYYEF